MPKERGNIPQNRMPGYYAGVLMSRLSKVHYVLVYARAQEVRRIIAAAHVTGEFTRVADEVAGDVLAIKRDLLKLRELYMKVGCPWTKDRMPDDLFCAFCAADVYACMYGVRHRSTVDVFVAAWDLWENVMLLLPPGKQGEAMRSSIQHFAMQLFVLALLAGDTAYRYNEHPVWDAAMGLLEKLKASAPPPVTPRLGYVPGYAPGYRRSIQE